MRHPHTQSVMDRLTMTTETTVKGFVSAQDTRRLLGYCNALLKLDRLTADDRAACERYLSNYSIVRYEVGPTKILRPLTKAEAHRIGRMRRAYNRRSNGKEAK